MATKKELTAQAKERKIKGYSTMTKAELEAALEKKPPVKKIIKVKKQSAKPVQPPEKAPASKESADMKFLKRMKNTVKDGKRLYAIFRKYGNEGTKLKWKNIRLTDYPSPKRQDLIFKYGLSEYKFDLEEIAERVREGKNLKGLVGQPNDWFNVFAGFKPATQTFSFEKLLANKSS